MGNAEHHLQMTANGARGAHLRFPGNAASVREALKMVSATLCEMPGCSARADVTEIVLAEVLNNVVEHALGDQGCGDVEVVVSRGPSGLHFQVRDDGVPMPDGAAPKAKAHDLSVEVEALPEGGFGWSMIRELTEELRYRRVENRNELTFLIPIDAGAPDS